MTWSGFTCTKTAGRARKRETSFTLEVGDPDGSKAVEGRVERLVCVCVCACVCALANTLPLVLTAERTLRGAGQREGHAARKC